MIIESLRLPFIVQKGNGKSQCDVTSLMRINLPNMQISLESHENR